MTSDQYRAAIASLGLSQSRAATFLGISSRTSQGYALGEHPIPHATAMLLELMLKQSLQPKDVVSGSFANK